MKIYTKKGKIMNQKQGTLVGIIILEAVLLPTVYFLFGRSIIATILVFFAIPIFMILLMKRLSSRSGNTIAEFQNYHPNEAILYSGLSEMICENSIIGTLVITDKGVYFLKQDVAEITECPILFQNIKEYICSVTLVLFTYDERQVEYKVFNDKDIDKVLSRYI